MFAGNAPGAVMASAARHLATPSEAAGELGPLGQALAGGERAAYNRGIRPGKAMTAPEREAYDAHVARAVKAIRDTRGGQNLPKSVEDFSKAIAEAKTATYARYTDMAKQAEAAGARVELDPAAVRLSKLASDPLQDPAAVGEAKRLLALIPSKAASITPTRAEEIVRYLNERATGFDTLGTKGAGSVFREASDALRGSLVDAVSKAGFPDYGELRRTYGGLATIEDDVGRATTRMLNQGGPRVGLSEMGAAGLAAAGEPVSAAAVQGGKFANLWLKSPNRAVKQLFEKAEKRAQPPKPRAPQKPPSALIPTGVLGQDDGRAR